MSTAKTKLFFVFGGLGLICFFLLNISLGSVNIPFAETFKILLGQSSENPGREYIILNYRLPKAITAVLTGSGLAVSGLLMQTLFRNPLAGPYVLGLSSGAGLGVALVILGGSVLGMTQFFLSSWGIIIAASLGSFLVMLAVIAASYRLKNTMAILIVGIMFAAFTGAIVSVLSYFSSSEQLQKYVFWSFGSLGNLSSLELGILFFCWLLGIVLAIFCLKTLNALLLGESYAKSMGAPIRKNRLLVIVATSLLAGSITAFAGPIAFVGLAVPHLVRIIIPVSNHLILMPAVIITGAILMLICDSIAQLPGSELTLPINAVTSMFGAPIVIWLLMRKKKLVF